MAIVEITSFEAQEGNANAFQNALAEAVPILTRQGGYIDHEFGVSVEQPSLFWLIVRWETLADHTEGFRKSADFESFVGAFRQFLVRPAAVSHFMSSAHGGGGPDQ